MRSRKRLGVPVVLFYSYSHRDEMLRDELARHLTVMQDSGYIREWHDRKILPGEEWDKQISANLEKADLILILISSDFLSSKYCTDIEAKRALDRHNNGEAILIPIILRPVVWKLSAFSSIQALPSGAQPITLWDNKDSAFENICQGILALIYSNGSEQKEIYSPVHAVVVFQRLSSSRLVILGPINADIYVDDERKGSTGSSGRVVLSDIPVGKHILRVSKTGERDDERVIEIREDPSEQVIQNSPISRQKVLDAALPEQVAVGKPIMLVVMIRSENSEGLRRLVRVNARYGIREDEVLSTESFSLEFPVDQSGQPQSIDFKISIESPEFVPIAQVKYVTVLPDKDSEPRIFLMKSVVEGELTVNLEVYDGEKYVAGFPLKTNSRNSIERNGQSTNLVSVPLNRKKPRLAGQSNSKLAGQGNPPWSKSNPKLADQSNSKLAGQESSRSTYESERQVDEKAPSDVLKVFWEKRTRPTRLPQNSGDYTLGAHPALVFGEKSRTQSILAIAGIAAFVLVIGGFFLLPQYQSYPTSSNESSAISGVHEIINAQSVYSETNEDKYGTLEQLQTSGFIDDQLASGEKSGYRFTVKMSERDKKSFEITAEPLSPESGKRSFYTNERGEIYFSMGNVGTRDNPGTPLK